MSTRWYAKSSAHVADAKARIARWRLGAGGDAQSQALGVALGLVHTGEVARNLALLGAVDDAAERDHVVPAMVEVL